MPISKDCVPDSGTVTARSESLLPADVDVSGENVGNGEMAGTSENVSSDTPVSGNARVGGNENGSGSARVSGIENSSGGAKVSNAARSDSASEDEDGRFEVAEEVNLDQQSDRARHIGQAPTEPANVEAIAEAIKPAPPDDAADGAAA